MSKPDWKDAPEWAEWLAMDEGGGWYWYGYKPWLNEASWETNNTNPNGDLVKFAGRGHLYQNWDKTLEPRPHSPDQPQPPAPPKDITIRDWFAGMVLPAVYAEAITDMRKNGFHNEWRSGIALDAYLMADQMIKRRNRS